MTPSSQSGCWICGLNENIFYTVTRTDEQSTKSSCDGFLLKLYPPPSSELDNERISSFPPQIKTQPLVLFHNRLFRWWEKHHRHTQTCMLTHNSGCLHQKKKAIQINRFIYVCTRTQGQYATSHTHTLDRGCFVSINPVLTSSPVYSSHSLPCVLSSVLPALPTARNRRKRGTCMDRLNATPRASTNQVNDNEYNHFSKLIKS